MDLTKKIKSLCDEKKISFAELERIVGISNGQVRKWGSVSPKNDNLLKVANYFNVSLDYLNGRSEIREIFKNYERIEVFKTEQKFELENMHQLQENLQSLSKEQLDQLVRYINFLKWETSQK